MAVFGGSDAPSESRRPASADIVANRLPPVAAQVCAAADSETALRARVLAFPPHYTQRYSCRAPRPDAPLVLYLSCDTPHLVASSRRRLTPVSQHRTKIDWLEKVAQTFYAVSLLAFPEWWLTENFVDGAALANNDSVLALASIMGLLCLTIIVITFIIRNAKNTRVELMKKMDIASAVTWSFFLVNSIRLQQDGMAPDAAFKQNLGIFSVIIGAFAYQSTTRKPKSK